MAVLKVEEMKSLKGVPIGKFIGKTAASAYHEGNNVFIGFSDGSSISIYTGISQFMRQFGNDVPRQEEIFSSIIGRCVRSIERKGGNGLLLAFDNDIEVRIESAQMPYESYLLEIEGSSFPV